MLPVMLDVSGKRCVIVGGGNAAYIKAKALLKNGTEVTVISEELSEKLAGMNIKYIKKSYSPNYIKDCFLVIAATDDKELNRRIKADAKNEGVKLFMSADGENSDLMFMAYTQSGGTKIAVSTNGAYPLLSARVCGELTDVCKKYDKLSVVLAEYRKKILNSSLSSEEKHELLEGLVSQKMLSITDIEQFKRDAEKIIGEKL